MSTVRKKKFANKNFFFFIRTKGHCPPRMRGDFSERCYISHAWSGERRATSPLLPPPPPPPKQKCWCVTVGVAFDYVAVQSKAVMLLSHLDRISLGRGNARSCVRRNAVTVWQPRFRQRDGGERGAGGELGVWSKCTTAFVACFVLFFSPPPTPHAVLG